MKLQWSLILLVIFGILAATCLAVLVAFMKIKPVKDAVAMTPKDTTVLTSSQKLEAMTCLTKEHIEEITMSTADTPVGCFKDAHQIIGKIVARPVEEGQIFTKNLFAREGTGKHLASTLPEGTRAFTVSLSDSAALLGLLYPGSMVDVLADFKLTGNSNMGTAVSTTLLEKIPVLAVESITVAAEQASEEEEKYNAKGRSPRSRGVAVTLLVNPEEAKALQLAQENGSITLVMRNPNDKKVDETDATLLSKGRLAGLAEALAISATVNKEKMNPPSKEQPVEVVKKAQPIKKKTKTREVDVFRGTQKSTVSFNLQ